MTSVEILRAWPGGPLRQFARVRPTTNWGVPYQSLDKQRAYANLYVCDSCQKPGNGVYSLILPRDAQIPTSPPSSGAFRWLCGPCRDRLRPKQEQPEGLRRAK